MSYCVKLNLRDAAILSMMEAIGDAPDNLQQALAAVPAGHALLVVENEGQPNRERQMVYGPDDGSCSYRENEYNMAIRYRGTRVFHVAASSVPRTAQ